MEHSHSHGHSHSHSVEITRKNKNAFLIGIGLNMAFVLAETIAGFANNSMALLTDAGHNLSDVASLVVTGSFLDSKETVQRYLYLWF